MKYVTYIAITLGVLITLGIVLPCIAYITSKAAAVGWFRGMFVFFDRKEKKNGDK
jgi:hypothetical protein